jgi:Cytochrome c
MASRKKQIAIWAGVAVVLMVAVGGITLYWLSREEPDLPMSAESGRQYFRHRDFGSPYETGIPYALALAALQRYPEELGGDKMGFCEKFGVLIDPDQPDGLPIGFVRHSDRLTGTDFLMTNCSLCHSAVVEGRVVVGLGNRNLRMNTLNHSIMKVAGKPDFTADTMVAASEAAARARGIPWGWRAALFTRKAVEVLKDLAGKPISDPWGGLTDVDAGPGRNSPVEFAKATSGVPVGPPYGLVKLPVVWNQAFRSTFGLDGSLKGDIAFTLAAVEFNKHMPADAIMRRESRWRSVDAYLRTLKPPPYPRAIDATLAARGQTVFSQECAKCHGTHPNGEPPKYEEKIVPLAKIGTDPDRLRAVTDALIEARSHGDFARVVHLERTDGYVPPPLIGIWCRGPYLHNASVPTLSDLLRPVEERPVRFYNGGDTGYDLDRIGLSYEEEKTADGRRVGRRGSSKQFLFDSKGAGNSNVGHEFGVDLPVEDRRGLLEYLKTL